MLLQIGDWLGWFREVFTRYPKCDSDAGDEMSTSSMVPWFHQVVVRPTLEFMAQEADRPWLASEAAQALLLGTAAIESNFAHIRQIGRGNSHGPGRGFLQCEPETAVDLVERYMARKGYRKALLPFIPPRVTVSTNSMDFKDAVQHNPALGCALARLKYADAPLALPEWHDVRGQEAYHKRFYNTFKGATKPGDYSMAFARHRIMSYLEGEFGTVGT